MTPAAARQKPKAKDEEETKAPTAAPAKAKAHGVMAETVTEQEASGVPIDMDAKTDFELPPSLHSTSQSQGIVYSDNATDADGHGPDYFSGGGPGSSSPFHPQSPADLPQTEPPPERNVSSVDPSTASLTGGSFTATIEGEFPDDADRLIVKISGPEMEGLYWTTATTVAKNSDSEIVASFAGPGDATAGEGRVFVQVNTGDGYGLYPGQPGFTWTE